MTMRVLVTGATGYIGGRLVPELLDRGHEVVCAARTPAKLDERSWRGEVEVERVDVLDRARLAAACEGVDVIYHLVHSMDGEEHRVERDLRAASNVRDAAAAAGVARIVYLGGLGREDDETLSDHLRSRHEVGRILASGSVPVTELRTAIIIGSGSASFEMLRHLVEVLPIMLTPQWDSTRSQPVAVRDVLTALCDVVEHEHTAGKVYEIGGPDVLSYAQLMQTYAEVAGLRRRVMLSVPVLSPRLSSLWINLVTPLPRGLARPLVDSLLNEVVVTDGSFQRDLPREMVPVGEALRLALARIQDLDVATTWANAGGAAQQLGGGDDADADAVAPADGDAVAGGTAAAVPSARGPEDPAPGDPGWAGGTVFADEREAVSSAPPEALFAAVSAIGGDHGYHTARWMWEIRGLMDKLVGGIGLQRGRRHPADLAVGEVIDFWRVTAIDRPHRLLLRAEMKVPGEAWLEFRIEPEGTGSRLYQRARFHPRGLWGRLYWGVLVPFHGLIFPRMARELAREAEDICARGSRG